MGGPTSEAPAAFYLVGMGVAIVEMLSKSPVVEGPATACRHCGRFLKLETSVGMGDINDKVFLSGQSEVKALCSAAANQTKRLESLESLDVAEIKQY